MTVIEGVEELGHLESAFGEMRGFGGGNALIYYITRFRGGEPEFPDFVGGLAGQEFGEVGGGDVAGNVSAEFVGIDSGFFEDAGGADYGVLGVGSGFTFEAESVFEVEGDYGLLGVLEHEIAQCADRDLGGDLQALFVGELRVARVDFFLGGVDEAVDQVVGFYAETLAA